MVGPERLLRALEIVPAQIGRRRRRAVGGQRDRELVVCDQRFLGAFAPIGVERRDRLHVERNGFGDPGVVGQQDRVHQQHVGIAGRPLRRRLALERAHEQFFGEIVALDRAQRRGRVEILLHDELGVVELVCGIQCCKQLCIAGVELAAACQRDGVLQLRGDRLRAAATLRRRTLGGEVLRGGGVDRCAQNSAEREHDTDRCGSPARACETQGEAQGDRHRQHTLIPKRVIGWHPQMTAALQPACLALAARRCMNKTARPAAWRKRLARPVLLGRGRRLRRSCFASSNAAVRCVARRRPPLAATGSQANG
ncbi:hypothetical protein ACVIM5_005060 [Bradyrhizobium sp. USDA 4512]